MSESKPDIRLIARQIKRAKKLPARSITCRVGGDRHHWHRVRPDWEPSNAAKAVMYQCSACTTIKRIDVDPKYGLIIGKPRYEYPPWFQLRRGKGDGTEKLMSPNAVRAVTAAQEVYESARPIDETNFEGVTFDD